VKHATGGDNWTPGGIQLGAPFAEGKEERKEKCAKENPGARGDMDGDRPGVNAEDKPDGDDCRIDKTQLLQKGGIGDIKDCVAAQNSKNARAKICTDGEGNGEHHAGKEEGLRDGDLAGCDRTVFFDRVIAVAIAVQNVVDDVNESRNGAESGCGKAGTKSEWREDAPPKESAGETYGVFCPLSWAKEGKEAPEVGG